MRRAMLVGAGALALSLSLPAHPCLAQSALGTRLGDYGGFLGLDLRFGDMGGELAAFAGGEAALLLKSRVYLGLRGGGLTTDNKNIPATGTSPGGTLAMGYGGLLVGYTVPTRTLVDIGFDALVGGGGVGTEDSNDEKAWDAIFVFEPSATANLKLTPFLRIGFGASYRFVGDVNVAGVTDDDLRGFSGLLRVRLGKF